MHVGILCEYGTVNGGENSILAMVERLSGIDVTFLAPPTGRLAERLAGGRHRHVALSLIDDAGRRLPREVALHVVRQAVDVVEPDLLHANSLAMGRLIGALRESLTIPTTAHLRDILRLNRSAVADLNRNDALLSVSCETLRFHVEQGIDADRSHVLYNGVDTEAFRPRTKSGALHHELGLPSSTPLIATIGQITLRKGHDVYVAAALLAASTFPQAHWLVVGERYSDKAETVAFDQRLRRQAVAAGLSDRIRWLGYRDDVPQLMTEIDLLVHPARQEPLGRVLLEAGAAGVPIIATRVGGTAEILEAGRSAVLVPPDDPQAIAAAVTDLLGDAVRRTTLGRAAHKAIVSRFDATTQAAQLAEHWLSLVSTGERGT